MGEIFLLSYHYGSCDCESSSSTISLDLPMLPVNSTSFCTSFAIHRDSMAALPPCNDLSISSCCPLSTVIFATVSSPEKTIHGRKLPRVAARSRTEVAHTSLRTPGPSLHTRSAFDALLLGLNVVVLTAKIFNTSAKTDNTT